MKTLQWMTPWLSSLFVSYHCGFESWFDYMASLNRKLFKAFVTSNPWLLIKLWHIEIGTGILYTITRDYQQEKIHLLILWTDNSWLPFWLIVLCNGDYLIYGLMDIDLSLTSVSTNLWWIQTLLFCWVQISWMHLFFLTIHNDIFKYLRLHLGLLSLDSSLDCGFFDSSL